MYKVIQNNEIIDVLERLHYVWRNPRNGVMLTCDAKRGQGVISHDGSTIYNIGTLADYPTVTLEEIDAGEYKRLRDLLDGVEETEEVVETAVESVGDPEEPTPEVREPMSVAEMRERITKMEENLRFLSDSIEFLTKLIGGSR